MADDADDRLAVVSLDSSTLADLIAGRSEICGFDSRVDHFPADAKVVRWWIEPATNPPRLGLVLQSERFAPVAKGQPIPQVPLVFLRRSSPPDMAPIGTLEYPS
jgi:hypothetical protein